MEITTRPAGEYIEVKPVGRLDGYWADHLTAALEEVLRQGHDRVQLNMSGVSYISSLGIKVLVLFTKKLQAIQGSFIVTEPSDVVSKVLTMVGLRTILMPATAGAHLSTPPSGPAVETENARIEIFPLGPGNMTCRIIGDPALLMGCRFTPNTCRKIAFPDISVGLGVGAFGENFEQCADRFGEFLSVAGASVFQPADGSNAADSLIAQGTFIPDVQMLYGVSCEGSFESLGRFEPRQPGAVTGLSELAEAALQIAKSDAACMVAVAESAGLIGANLRKPPVNGDSGETPFAFPDVRNWLSFTSEPVYTRALALLVGIVSRRDDAHLDSFLRPLGRGDAKGHFHGAGFSYRPLQRGSINLAVLTRSLLENESLLGVKHLIADNRSGTLIESRFYRGACWVSPIGAIHRS